MEENKGHAERSHAILSASGSDRWMNCTPSARMEEKYPNEESPYAKEGELAHEISESMLRQRTGLLPINDHQSAMRELILRPEYYLGMIDDVEPYVNFVLEKINSVSDPWFLFEHKIDLSAFIPEGKGTGDSILFLDKTLHVIDLKFGKGVRVDAQENSQLMLYAAGALKEFGFMFDIETIEMVIVQPRLDHISIFKMTPDELIDWVENSVKPKAQIAFKGEGELCAGDWCKFCKAKVECPKLKEETLEIAQIDFAAFSSEADAMGLEAEFENSLLSIFEKANRIRDFLDAVSAHLLKRAIAGHKWTGLKLVEGRSMRRIDNEKLVMNALVEKGFKFSDFTNNKLKGIGDLEKLLGKDGFEQVLSRYVSKPRGNATLVSDSDPRPEMTTADDFKE